MGEPIWLQKYFFICTAKTMGEIFQAINYSVKESSSLEVFQKGPGLHVYSLCCIYSDLWNVPPQKDGKKELRGTTDVAVCDKDVG